MVNRGRFKNEINWFPFSKKTEQWLGRLIRFRHGQGFRSWMGWMGCMMMAVLGSTSSFADASVSQKGKLAVRVSAIQSARGNLMYLLFRSEDGFPREQDKAFRGGSVKITSTDDLTLQIADLPYGEYAMSVFQDENENGKLDTNFLGIPNEPVGASRDPKGRMGPPRYEDAKFEIKNPELEITIHLVKP